MPHAHCGSITVEVLIAFTVFTLSATALILTHAGAADAVDASGIHTDFIALGEVRNQEIRSRVATDFYATSTATTSERNGLIFAVDTRTTHISECLLEAGTEVTAGHRAFTSIIRVANTLESERLGYDCAYGETGSWAVVDAQMHSESGKGTALDASSGVVVVGLEESPYLGVLSRGEFAQIPAGLLESYPNAIDAAVTKYGTHLVFVALASSIPQLAVIDISDTDAPVLIASTTLRNVDPNGFKPEGWRLKYYDKRLYVSTLETAGPELHTFAVTEDGVQELGSGVSVNITFNDFVIRSELVGSTHKKFLYAATSRDAGEIAVYDVTDPGGIGQAIEVTNLRQNLPGAQDGESIAVVGNRLYLGRASNTGGPELYVYDITDMPTSMTLLGTAEIPSVSVSGIQVVDGLAFLAITPGVTNRRIDIWDVSEPERITRVYTYAYPGLRIRGIEYATDGVYAVSDRSPYLVRLTPYAP